MQIRRRGVDAAVVLSFEDYARLVKPKGVLARSPLARSELAIEHPTDPARPVDL